MPHLSGSFRFEQVDPPPVDPLLCADTHKISHKHRAGNLSPNSVFHITRFSIFLAAVALTILALLAACGPDAPSDPTGIESTDRSTSAPAADQERSTAAATSASQATSVSSGRATPTLDPHPRFRQEVSPPQPSLQPGGSPPPRQRPHHSEPRWPLCKPRQPLARQPPFPGRFLL